MQGISIVLASGDSGVAGPAGDGGNADGCLGTGQIFSPDFPATCPYLTTVGATYLPPTGNVFKDQETAVTRFGSGGGKRYAFILAKEPLLTIPKVSRTSTQSHHISLPQYRPTSLSTHHHTHPTALLTTPTLVLAAASTTATDVVTQISLPSATMS